MDHFTEIPIANHSKIILKNKILNQELICPKTKEEIP
jgi:hypothetical protein